jgi:hypothetical protein
MGCNRSRCQQVCAQSVNHHVIIPAPAPCGGLGFGGLGYDGIGLGGLGYGGCGGLGGAGLVGAGLAGPGLAGPGCGLYWDNNVS